jgi:pimeloyl-ACP methyl ester carboxylesterase
MGRRTTVTTVSGQSIARSATMTQTANSAMRGSRRSVTIRCLPIEAATASSSAARMAGAASRNVAQKRVSETTSSACLSDPVSPSALPTIDEWMDDVSVILDEVGSDRAALITNIGGGLMAMAYAAAHPERVTHLVLVDCFARFLEAPDFPIGAHRKRSSRGSSRPMRGRGAAGAS